MFKISISDKTTTINIESDNIDLNNMDEFIDDVTEKYFPSPSTRNAIGMDYNHKKLSKKN